jgi:hypothetical protein
MGANETYSPFNVPTSTDGVSTVDSDYPDYLRAADLHNIGSSNQSWFSNVADSIANAPEFFTVSVLSGLNSFYNTGVEVANLFGNDAKENETGAWISDLDSDLGKYYQENQASADTMGFILGSLVGGLGGIKILNAGQKALAVAKSGLVGTNIGAALGLRTPMIEFYIATAAKDIASGQAMYSSLQSAGVKALATGVYQNVLEGIAFETTVQATMHASPVLRDQSISDIAWNVATGGAFQGVLGGAFHAASTIGKINSATNAIVKEIRPYGSRILMNETGTENAGLKIAALAKDLEHGPVPNPGDANYVDEIAALKARQVRIQNDMRETTHSLVVGNQRDLGNMVANLNHGEDSITVLQRMADTDQITSVNGATKIEKEMNSAVKLDSPIDPNLQVHYWKLTGDNAGVVLNTSPPVVNLADTLAESSKGSLRDKVMSAVRSNGFKIADLWDASVLPLTSSQGHLEAEARQIWASSKETLKEIKPGTQVHKFDFPVLERALADGVTDLTLVDSKGLLVRNSFNSTQEMQDYLVTAKKEVQRILQQNALKSGTPFMHGGNLTEAQNWVTNKIAKITNTKIAAVEGSGTFGIKDYLAWQDGAESYKNELAQKGLKPVKDEELDPRFLPTWAKVTKRVRTGELPDGTVVDAMAHFEELQQIAQQGVDNVIAKNLPEFHSQLPELTRDDLSSANPRGTGSGFLTFSNPGYGDPLGVKTASIGSIVQRATQAAKGTFAKNVEGELAALGRNNGAVIEWGGLHQKTARSALQWVPMELEDGERGLVSTEAIKHAGEDPVSMEIIHDIQDSKGGVHFIPVEHDETWHLVNAHTAQENVYAQTGNELGAAVGKTLSKQRDIFRPIPPNPNDYKYIAFVKDPKVTGQGHTSMLFAQKPEDLETLIKKTKEARPDLDIHTTSDTAEFYKARDSYQYDRTLSENYIDSSLKNEGVMSDYYIKTDPQRVINDYLEYHTRKIDTQTRELVRAKYQPQFDWLEDQASYYSKYDTSKIGGNIDKLEATAKNPYLSYIKTALNLSRANENPLWHSVNKAADSAVSTVVDKVKNIFEGIKGTPDSKEFQYGIDNINRTLQKYGMNTGYMDAATELVVNSKLPQGELSKFVRGANALLSRLVLGLDPLNSVTNAVGANILRMTELSHQIDAIAAGNTDVAGALAKLSKVDLTGKGDLITSAAKLNAGGITAYFKALWNKDASEVANLALFKQLGVIKDSGSQFKSALDALTLKGSESVQELNPKLQAAQEAISKLVKTGEKATGNYHAEEMNRFATAWGMKKLTDPLVEAGEMSTAEQAAYINTHVNRVEGNTIASQRPFVFQGPIGQAIGLFQTYQFNLMQQMFRYVAEGSRKDAAMLLGLQGTFFGIQGLPAFQAINQHIIGNASGNTRHVDAYDATVGIAGKNIGELLLYGLPSNLLQTNLYSRGDINPRSVTILPSTLDQVPIINATMKFFGGIKDAVSKIATGGNVWESMLQGVEHSSLSRPLAGLAQTLQATTGDHYVMSTTNAGGLLFRNDLMNLGTLSRLAGGRPMDEAVVNDAVYRIHSYAQADHAKMLNIAGAIKASNISGQEMDGGQIGQFAREYAGAGGRLINFNKFMIGEIKSVQQSEAEKITTNLKSPYSQRMQSLMGGAYAPSSITDMQ